MRNRYIAHVDETFVVEFLEIPAHFGHPQNWCLRLLCCRPQRLLVLRSAHRRHDDVRKINHWVVVHIVPDAVEQCLQVALFRDL